MTYSQLPVDKQRLLRRSRKNLIKAGLEMPPEWKVGDRLLTGVECMFNDIGVRPSASHSLARKDRYKPHSMENSYWSVCGSVTSKWITWNGRQWTMSELSDVSGLRSDYISNRLKTMTVSQSLLTPKSTKTLYPSAKADLFFQSLDMRSMNYQQIANAVTEERARFKLGYKSRSRNLGVGLERFQALIQTDIVQTVLQLLELKTLDMISKSKLFAYLACPASIKQRTAATLRRAIDRCRNPKCRDFHHYGGRGIDVCERWVSGDGELDGLQCFVLDVGPYQPRLELDRIDNDGNYEAGNCRWVTRTINMRNAFRVEDIASRLNAMVEEKVNQIAQQKGYESVEHFELIGQIDDL